MIAEIENRLDGIGRDLAAVTKARPWSAEIFDSLCALGRSKGLSTYAQGHPPSADGPSFLYDLCWLQYDTEQCLVDNVLALECEWCAGDSNIDHDFQKLLIASASIRVMIFQKPTQDELIRMLASMECWIDRARCYRRNTTFLLSGWSLETQRFAHRRKVAQCLGGD